MDRLLKISEKTNIIIHALAYIAAQNEEGHVAVSQMAKELKVSETYLAKVLQPIAKAGILKSVRGAKGGFSLAKDPKEIKMLDLLIMAEGELPEHNCLFGLPICQTGHCAFSQLNEKIKNIITEDLSDTTLEDVKKSFNR